MRTFLFFLFAAMFVASILAGIVALIPESGPMPITAQSCSDTVFTVCIIAFLLSCIGLAKTSLQMKINKG